ncbi:glycosyltransferase family 4 protein [Mucilaginibacter pedocola]|uniref:Glycosyl transferase family 1 domain-containing protein n=1 Tax=Mucilaginibacter pedocola TaxID=1792845 RepID=A0A1S9P9L0_9SPHI|nr:glycosyltransferase family 4 protein [Mucilaginibacter pedocola]OOQ57268.1 hypothetical protein BC343_14220 [Mucilaginibacter pedocola]
MRFVFAGYVHYSNDFDSPDAWLQRTNAYTGILQALARHNEVISIEQINYQGRQFSNGVDYHFRRYPRLALRYFPQKLNRYIKQLRPDVVVIHSLNFPFQVILLRLMLGRRVKIMVQNHAEKPANGIKKHLQRLASRCTDAYLFASYAMGLDWVKAGSLSSPLKIHEAMEVSSVFYPIDKTEARQRTGADGNPVFLWVGRLNANKDPLCVLRAFLKYAAKHPDARLYMLYHTEELLQEVKTLLDENEHGPSVTLIGKVPHAELLYWLNSADFILSGSHYEGSGASVCEAMSCGCVPIVTDILSFRMITNNGDCGMLYPPGDEQALLETLLQTDNIDITEKRQKSLAYFKSHLSFDAIAKCMAEIAYSL